MQSSTLSRILLIAGGVAGLSFGAYADQYPKNQSDVVVLQSLRQFTIDQMKILKDKNDREIVPTFKRIEQIHQDVEALRGQLDCMLKNGKGFDDDQESHEEQEWFRAMTAAERNAEDPCSKQNPRGNMDSRRGNKTLEDAGALGRSLTSYRDFLRSKKKDNHDINRISFGVDRPMLGMLNNSQPIYSKKRVRTFFRVYVNRLNDEQIELANLSAYSRQIHDKFTNEAAHEALSQSREILEELALIHDMAAGLVIRWAKETLRLNYEAWTTRETMAFNENLPMEGAYALMIGDIEHSGKNGEDTRFQWVPSQYYPEGYKLEVPNTYALEVTIEEMERREKRVDLAREDKPGSVQEEDLSMATFTSHITNMIGLLDLSKEQLETDIALAKADANGQKKVNKAQVAQVEKAGNANVKAAKADWKAREKAVKEGKTLNRQAPAQEPKEEPAQPAPEPTPGAGE